MEESFRSIDGGFKPAILLKMDFFMGVFLVSWNFSETLKSAVSELKFLFEAVFLKLYFRILILKKNWLLNRKPE